MGWFEALRGMASAFFRQTAAVSLGVASLLCAACSSQGGASNGSGSSAVTTDAGIDAAPQVSCQSDKRVSSAALPLTVSGPNGFAITLSGRDPDPSAKGLNDWEVSVADATGAPVVGAKLTLATNMPDHGHSSSAPAPPDTDASGHSTLSALDFFMAGVWRVQIDVLPTGAAKAADSVVFFFCIEG